MMSYSNSNLNISSAQLLRRHRRNNLTDDEFGKHLRLQFDRFSESGLSKHAQLQKALQNSIADGKLKPGDQIPAEKNLAQLIGVSLGTVQRALSKLSSSGVIFRKHGRGSFVADEPRAFVRFINEQGAIMPVSMRVLDRKIIHTKGSWYDALGTDPMGFIRIRRVFNVSGFFYCYNEYYISVSQFPTMIDHPIDDSARLNWILVDETETPILRVQQRVGIQKLSARICHLIKVNRGSSGLKLELVAFSFDDRVVSYQQSSIPENSYMLDLSVLDWNPRRAKAH